MLSFHLWDTHSIRNLLFLFNVSNYMGDVNAFDTWLCFYRLQLGNHKMYAHRTCTTISLLFIAIHLIRRHAILIACHFDEIQSEILFNLIIFWKLQLFCTLHTLCLQTHSYIHSTKIAFFSRSHFFYRIFIGGSVVKRLDFDERLHANQFR